MRPIKRSSERCFRIEGTTQKRAGALRCTCLLPLMGAFERSNSNQGVKRATSQKRYSPAGLPPQDASSCEGLFSHQIEVESRRAGSGRKGVALWLHRPAPEETQFPVAVDRAH